MDDDVKVTVTLPRRVVDGIRRLAAANHTTLATAITESVEINERLTRAEETKARIILHERDGSMTEIVRDRSAPA